MGLPEMSRSSSIAEEPIFSECFRIRKVLIFEMLKIIRLETMKLGKLLVRVCQTFHRHSLWTTCRLHITLSYMNTSHVLSENQADEQRPIIHQHHNQLRKPDPERVFGPLECRNRHVGYVVYKACLPNLQCRNPVARNFKGPRRSLSAVLALISFRTGKVRPSNFLCLSSISIHPNQRFLTAYTFLVILAFPYQWSRRRSL